MGKKRKEQKNEIKKPYIIETLQKNITIQKSKKNWFQKEKKNFTKTIDNNQNNSSKNSQIDTKNYRYSKINLDDYLKLNDIDNSPELNIKKKII